MDLSNFDIFGIVIFALVAFYIYRKGWFYSFYSFFKFLIVFLISLFAGLYLAPKIPNFLHLSTLQNSLIVQGFLFLALWKIISFKKVFFLITDRVIPVNRFVFFSHIDYLLNIIPSATVSFFFCFFLFTTLVTASTSRPALQHAIESSKLVRPLAYKIYFASVNSGETKLFDGIAFDLTPSVTFIKNDIPQTETGGGTSTFTPYISVTPIKVMPTDPPEQHLVPTPQIQPTDIPIQKFFPTDTPIPTAIPTQQIFPPNPPQPVQQNPNPTATPAPYIPPPVVQPIIQIIQPPLNISQVEQDIFRLTNQERIKFGLTPFTLSESISQVARNHSEDMNNRNYFDHKNPDGLDPLLRIQNAGIPFTTQGENIAGGPTADLIVTNWMNSPGHRANILNPNFNKIGIGVSANAKYGTLATQNFTD